MGRLRGGFSMVEILVVMAIITMLAGMGFYMFDVAREREKQVETRNTIQRLSEAIEAYYDKTLKYPDDLAADSPNGGAPGSGVPAGQGYLAVLRGRVTTSFREEGGTHALKSQSVYFYDPKPEFIFDPDHVMDVWGFPIQYRLAPRNTEDFRTRFKDAIGFDAKSAVLQFPGNPKKYNLWSGGDAEGGDAGQVYKGELGTPKKGSTLLGYKSGGYSEDIDKGKEIGNW